MSSKKKTSESKSFLSTIGGKLFGGSEREEVEIAEETIETPEKQPIGEKKGGKTRRLSKFGSRRQVWNGSAEMTPGRLRKEQLVKNDRGRIVSIKRHTTMKTRHGSS